MFHDVMYMHKLMDNKNMFYQMHTLALPLARVVTLGRINNYNRHDMIVNNITSNDSELRNRRISKCKYYIYIYIIIIF